MRKGLALTLLSLTFGASSASAAFVPQTAYTGTVKITRQSGPVQHHPKVFLVFWGRSWQRTSPVVLADEALFREMRGSAFVGQLGRYGVRSESFGGSVFIHRYLPRRMKYADLARIAAEAAHRLHVRDLRNAQFLISPGDGFNLANFSNECGEHDYLTRAGRSYVVGLIMPFLNKTAAGCTYDYSTNNGVRPADLVMGTTSIMSHEFVEAATDPYADGSGWMMPHDANQVELVDPCYFNSGVSTGMAVNVTYVWNVARRACELP